MVTEPFQGRTLKNKWQIQITMKFLANVRLHRNFNMKDIEANATTRKFKQESLRKRASTIPSFIQIRRVIVEELKPNQHF